MHNTQTNTGTHAEGQKRRKQFTEMEALQKKLFEATEQLKHTTVAMYAIKRFTANYPNTEDFRDQLFEIIKFAFDSELADDWDNIKRSEVLMMFERIVSLVEYINQYYPQDKPVN